MRLKMGKGTDTPAVDIIQQANSLLDTIKYNQNCVVQNQHCTVEVVSNPCDDDATLHGVIVYVTPNGAGDLAKVTKRQRLSLTFKNCTCGSNNYQVGRKEWKKTGIAESFNHPKRCLDGRFKMQIT